MDSLIRHYSPGGKQEDIVEAMTLEEVREKLKGYVEVVRVGRVCIMCDEEGKIKGLPVCGHIGVRTFVGELFVGKLTSKGLGPVPAAWMQKFESEFRAEV